jgi:hypothetical protein
MRTRPNGVVLALALALGASLAASPQDLDAATPSPSILPDEERPPERPLIQVWLDEPLQTEAPPGDEVTIGATLWDTLGGLVPDMGATVFLRALPADGAGEPIRATAISDWPGHYRGIVVVPPGGLGGVELGTSGTMCENDICRPDDWVFEIAGDGPPPDAPITSLAAARIEIDGDELVAGRPTDLDVLITPNAEWLSLPLPDLLVVRAREPRGPKLAAASLRLADTGGMTYAGSITIPRSGDLVLEAATDEDGGDATRFGTSMTPVTVGEASDGDAAPAPVGDAGDDGLPPVLILLLGVVAVVGVGVIVTGFRAGSR